MELLILSQLAVMLSSRATDCLICGSLKSPDISVNDATSLSEIPLKSTAAIFSSEVLNLSIMLVSDEGAAGM